MEEALWFSARLRLSKDINNKRMWAFIHEVRYSTVHAGLLCSLILVYIIL